MNEPEKKNYPGLQPPFDWPEPNNTEGLVYDPEFDFWFDPKEPKDTADNYIKP